MNTQVEILVNGKPVKQYRHEGKTFIEARINTEYTIKVKNNCGQRKLAVITVDGVNAITGQPHTNNGVGEGYIINAYDAIEIKGFRKDMNSVGAFKFCQAGKSYCNEQGLKGNNGVIGVRVYEERVTNMVFGKNYTTNDNKWPATPLDPYPRIEYTDNSSPGVSINEIDHSIYCSNNTHDSINCVRGFCETSNLKSTPNFDAGTTWGKSINDRVIDVYFDTNESEYTDFVIYYDVKKNLEKIGICFVKEKQVYYPKAFNTFATPPKGWRG